MSFLNAEGLVKSYGAGEAKVTALGGIDLYLDQGEFTAIMGPSGSGKSTLLALLGALTTPDAGSYKVDGIDIFGLSPDRQADFRREYLGFVFQSFNLVSYLTLAENVMLPLAIKDLSKAEQLQMAHDALDRVGLGGKEHRLPSEVSGGEQERAAVARAVVNRPPILLADEPTGNLDAATSADVMRLLTQMCKEGMTIVMVTHSEQCASHAQRIIRVADGRLANQTVECECTPAAERPRVVNLGRSL